MQEEQGEAKILTDQQFIGKLPDANCPYQFCLAIQYYRAMYSVL